MTNWLDQHPDTTRQPEGMSDAVGDLLESFTEDELDVDKQISNFEEIIEQSDPTLLLEKVSIGMIISTYISSIDVSDDGIGIGPSLTEYMIGKIISHDKYRDSDTSYKDLARAAAKIQQAYLMSNMAGGDPESLSEEEMNDLYLRHC